jgi:hypothetical protein
VQPVLKQIHVHPDFCLGDPGIKHGGTNLGMAQHFADCLDRHAIHQSDRSCKSVAGEVESQVFLNSADFGKDFQTSIYLLITHAGENCVSLADLHPGEFFQNGLGRPEKGDVYWSIGFGSRRLYPFDFVNSGQNLLRLEIMLKESS